MTLHISNLSKRYGNNWVLRDVSFEVVSGHVLCVLAAAGAGKSTLARMLSGQEKPSPVAAQFGMAGHSAETVLGNAAEKGIWPFTRRNRARPDIRMRLTDAIEKATDILVLDDPMCSADREMRDRLLAQIRKAASTKRLSVIYTTADFETAAILSDTIAVLADSFIQQLGTAEAIYDSPATTQVARLTGRCNIFPARRLTSTKFEIPEFQTIAGRHRLFTEKADIGKLGSIDRNVSLAIRPESISMSFGASFPEDNLLKAVVTAIKYLGPSTLVELDANGLDLEAEVPRLVGLDVGQECMLGLPPDRIRILRD